jgi:polyhydroxybutyrate depolymerase
VWFAAIVNTVRRTIGTAAILALVAFCAACSDAGSVVSGAPALGALTGRVAAGPPVPSSGCSAPPGAAVSDQRHDVELDGADRWYLLTTPPPSTPDPTVPGAATDATLPSVARPLVVDFHGLAEGAAIHATTSGFGTVGQHDGFVVAFPDGTGNPVQWDTSSQSGANPDLQFVTAMLDQLESTQCIDTSRVYASGFSDGSFMVSLLACTMSDRFAAIGAVSGLQLPVPCPATRHVPIVAFHGTADPILYFNGGIGTDTLNRALGRGGPAPADSTTTTTRPTDLHGPGYPATVQAWAVKDGCSPRSSDSRIASRVVLRTYRCPARTGVEFYIILGGGHSWPGSTFSQAISSITGYTTFEIDATTAMWAFFRQFRL